MKLYAVNLSVVYNTAALSITFRLFLPSSKTKLRLPLFGRHLSPQTLWNNKTELHCLMRQKVDQNSLQKLRNLYSVLEGSGDLFLLVSSRCNFSSTSNALFSSSALMKISEVRHRNKGILSSENTHSVVYVCPQISSVSKITQIALLIFFGSHGLHHWQGNTVAGSNQDTVQIGHPK